MIFQTILRHLIDEALRYQNENPVENSIGRCPIDESIILQFNSVIPKTDKIIPSILSASLPSRVIATNLERGRLAKGSNTKKSLLTNDKHERMYLVVVSGASTDPGKRMRGSNFKGQKGRVSGRARSVDIVMISWRQ